ncbi:MAG: hypothetical protein JW923_03525 [Spirochaetales bacterium]|nr:hypothetical protein [Spirochaetales bacterium]
MGRIILVSGERGSGKTSCAKRAADMAKSRARCDGVLCPATFLGSAKTDIRWLRVGSDLSRVLARAYPESPDQPGRPSLDPEHPLGLRLGRWLFDRAELENADRVLEAAILSLGSRDAFARAALVDELGPLELDHGLGFTLALKALDTWHAAAAPGYRAAVVMARPEIRDRLMARWSGSETLDVGTLGAEQCALALASMVTPAGDGPSA